MTKITDERLDDLILYDDWDNTQNDIMDALMELQQFRKEPLHPDTQQILAEMAMAGLLSQSKASELLDTDIQGLQDLWKKFDISAGKALEFFPDIPVAELGMNEYLSKPESVKQQFYFTCIDCQKEFNLKEMVMGDWDKKEQFCMACAGGRIRSSSNSQGIEEMLETAFR